MCRHLVVRVGLGSIPFLPTVGVKGRVGIDPLYAPIFGGRSSVQG